MFDFRKVLYRGMAVTAACLLIPTMASAQSQSESECRRVVSLGADLVRPDVFASCMSMLGLAPEATRAGQSARLGNGLPAVSQPQVPSAPELDTSMIRLDSDLCAYVSGGGGSSCSIAQGVLGAGSVVHLRGADGGIVEAVIDRTGTGLTASLAAGQTLPLGDAGEAGALASATIGFGRDDAGSGGSNGSGGSGGGQSSGGVSVAAEVDTGLGVGADVSVGGVSVSLGL